MSKYENVCFIIKNYQVLSPEGSCESRTQGGPIVFTYVLFSLILFKEGCLGFQKHNFQEAFLNLENVLFTLVASLVASLVATRVARKMGTKKMHQKDGRLPHLFFLNAHLFLFYFMGILPTDRPSFFFL